MSGKRKTIGRLQVEQEHRAAVLIDNQLHMRLTGHAEIEPPLLSAREAFRQGFHAGARWGLRVGRRKESR